MYKPYSNMYSSFQSEWVINIMIPKLRKRVLLNANFLLLWNRNLDDSGNRAQMLTINNYYAKIDLTKSEVVHPIHLVRVVMKTTKKNAQRLSWRLASLKKTTSKGNFLLYSLFILCQPSVFSLLSLPSYTPIYRFRFFKFQRLGRSNRLSLC